MKQALQVTVVLLTMVLTYLCMIILPEQIVILVVTILGCILGMVMKHVFF